MTFNLRFENDFDGENHWLHRRDFLVETILKYRPHVLGTQEGKPSQLAFLEKKLDGYKGIVSEKLLSEVVQAAKKLEGLRIVHINATPQGGGVAEILKSMVPLMRDVGIKAEWYALSPEESFFRISKRYITVFRVTPNPRRMMT